MGDNTTTRQPINRHTVEDSYRRCKQAQESHTFGSRRFSDLAFTHARNRDPKMLIALEKASNIMQDLWEDQLGEYSRSSSIEYSHTKKPVEVQLWQEAYRLADEGNAIRQLIWIYYAAYELAYGRIER